MSEHDDNKHRQNTAEGQQQPAEEATPQPAQPESPAEAAATAEAEAEAIVEPAATAEAAAVEAPQRGGEAAQLEAEIAELKDRLLRAVAETENVRRRAARDVEDARKYAITGFARDLLEVADNLGRALQSIPEPAKGDIGFVKNLAEGVEMTEKALLGVFERHKVRKVEPQPGDRFDHNLHQAMFEVEAADQPPGTVAQVLQSGYVIEDRLLRPAMVGVAKGSAKAEAAEAEAEEERREARPGERLDTTA